MDIKKITLSFEEYSSKKELNPPDRELLEQAILTSESSYSPYSSFRVGAAARLSNGVIVAGNNQENAAYPSGLCAERIAMFYAQSRYPDTGIESLALFASPSDFLLKNPVTPCGSCRQVMAEYEHRHNTRIRIIMANGDGFVQVTDGVENLLPMMFYLEELKKH